LRWNEITRYVFDSYYRPIGKGQIGFFIKTTGRVNNPSAAYQECLGSVHTLLL